MADADRHLRNLARIRKASATNKGGAIADIKSGKTDSWPGTFWDHDRRAHPPPTRNPTSATNFISLLHQSNGFSLGGAATRRQPAAALCGCVSVSSKYLTFMAETCGQKSVASAHPEHASHGSGGRAITRHTHAASLKTRLKFRIAARGFSSTWDFAAASRVNNR
jgi:hypothetical protein